MNLTKLFQAVDEQQQDNKKMAENLENRTAKFLKLIGKAFCFEHSPYSLLPGEVDELSAEKDFMIRTEQDLKAVAGVDLTYIYEATEGGGSGQPDTFHPDRGKIGSFVVKIPVVFSAEVRQIIDARAAEAKKPVEPTVYSKEEKLDFGLQAYCDGRTEAASAETAGITIIAFRAALSKFSRDREKMQLMLGPRWRNRAEMIGILKATEGRHKTIEGIADERVAGKTVVQLAKKYKVSLGVVTSVLGHFGNLGERFLYDRYFPEYKQNWRQVTDLAFINKYYAPNMMTEFLEAGGTEKDFNQQQTDFYWSDGWILA